MSAPETKALPPAPDRMRIRTLSSAAKRAVADSTASHISSDTALRFSGWLKMIRAISPDCSVMILSVMGPSVFCRRLGGARGFHLGELCIAQADLGQDLGAMLARLGRRRGDMAAGAAHDDGLAHQFRLAPLLAGDGLSQAKVAHLRIAEDLPDIVDLAGGNARLGEQIDPV